MKLTEKHQELLDKLYPDGYKIEKITLLNGDIVDEGNYFHILFVKIIEQPGQYENKLVAAVQKMTVSDWKTTEQMIAKFNIGGITQYDEYGIIHDPTKVKTGPKPKKVESQ